MSIDAKKALDKMHDKNDSIENWDRWPLPQPDESQL